MNSRNLLLAVLALLSVAACKRASPPSPAVSAFGDVIVDISGQAQVEGVGATLEQPLTVQVNDAERNGVSGARVEFSGSNGVRIAPASGLTGNDGQFAASVQLGTTSGRYSVTATTRDKTGNPHQVSFIAIALGYRETSGRELSEKHCSRCHDAQSTAERVSNHDNLSAEPHAFTDGATLNRISPANLTAIITHGGLAVGKSAEMPPYSPTLSASEIDALTAYIRAVADPPYRPDNVQANRTVPPGT